MTNTPTRRRDLTVALASMTGVAAIVVGVPLLLSLLAGWPLPATVPTLTQMRHALDDGWAPNATFVLKSLAAVAWLAWLQIVAALTAEAFAVARGYDRHRRLPVGWAGPLAARLIAGILLLQALGHQPVGELPPIPIVQRAPILDVTTDRVKFNENKVHTEKTTVKTGVRIRVVENE